MKTACLFIGISLGLYLGVAVGVAFERYYVMEWKKTAFVCLDELVDCRSDLEFCPRRNVTY